MSNKCASQFKLLLILAVGFFFNMEKSIAQVMATPAQKAKALYVTQQKKDSSIARRNEYDNSSASNLITPGGYDFRIDGPTTVDRNSKQSYYSVPPAPLGAWWYVSHGTVIEYYDDIITIQFNTSVSSLEIILFDQNDYRLSNLTVNIIGDAYPLSAGQILTGTQSVKTGETPAVIFATAAEGGSCGGNYHYQWQYSYNDSLYNDIEDAISDSLIIEGDIDETVYFRRKVVCGSDSQYTGSVVVFLIPPFSAGVITTPNQTIVINTVPPQINATIPIGGECSGYIYQWQQSADGYSFANISGATSQNLSYPTPMTGNVFFRRRSSCDTLYKYTNIILIKVKDTLTTPVITVKNSIDSLFESAGINIASLFNLYNDSVVNNRPVPNPAMDTLEANYKEKQILSGLNNAYGTLEQADINELFSDTLKDNIQARLDPENTSYGAFDSSVIPLPFISDTLIDQYLAANDMKGLDSLFSMAPSISIKDAFQSIEDERNAAIPVAERTYTTTLEPESLVNSVVIRGPVIVHQNETLHYTASFYYPLGNSSNIKWTINGGIIVSQNVNPANGEIFVNVLWQSPSTPTPSVSIIDLVSSQYQILPVYYTALGCNNIYPITQTLFYGQTPNFLQIGDGCTASNGYTMQYQWQVIDHYGSNVWTNIPGGTTITYQPPALVRPVLIYKRITRIYTPSNVLYRTFSSSGSQVKLQVVNAGQYQTPNGTNIPYNTVPVVTQTQTAFGGMLILPGGTYSYAWEASIAGGGWQQIGTGATFPNYPITQNQKIRWVVTITGVPSSVYSLPQQYWKGYSAEISFTVKHQSENLENRNYIRETAVLTRGADSWVAVDLLTIENKTQTTTYLDGLSRPIQVVGKGVHYDDTNNTWYDFVQNIDYGEGGRVDKTLLPYPTMDNPGKFKTNSSTAQPAYYQSKFNDVNAFSKVEYDNSPLNRVIKAYAPGDKWVGDNVSVYGDRALYISNVNSIPWFTVGYGQGEIPVIKGIYPTGALFAYQTMDEKGKSVLTFVNISGQVVFKKVQLVDVPNTNTNEGYICTYYVYDDFGQLRFTVTPKAFKEVESNNWVITTEIANELCFWYDYDDLGRVIAKKVPGKNAELMVYDRKNRLVFSQDAGIALSETGNPILTTLYDYLGRPVISGLLYGKTMNDWASFIDTDPTVLTTVNTTYGGSVVIQGSPLTASEINNPAIFKQLTFNYYNDYNYNSAKTFDATHVNNLVYKNAVTNGNVEPGITTKRYNGLQTGSRVRVMNGNNTSPQFVTSSIFYDEEGRLIQGQEDNIKGGVEITSTQYYFDSRVLSSSVTHNATGTAYTNFNIITKYKFDKIGRVVGIGKKINNSNRNYINSQNVQTAQEDDDADYKIISIYKYNELNQRVKKSIAPEYNNGQGLETIDYSYNIRGWLTGINKDYALNEYNSSQWEHYFGMYLGYENKDGKFAASQFNGSITGVQWKSQGDNTPRKFDYTYDNAGRLKAADFNQKGTSNENWNKAIVDFSTKDVLYDDNGNLQTMTQMGILPGAATPIMIDKLTYSYRLHSNKLMRVDDAGNAGIANGKQADFKDGSNAANSDDYSYDVNGRIVLDNNKLISNIKYNYLDKPELITIAAPSGSNGGGTIKYIYDAGGSKFQKIVTENPATSNGNQQKIITTTYIAQFIYESVTLGNTTQPEELQMIMHEEGRIRVITPYNNPSDPANFIGGGVALPGGKQGVFDYFIKDNLGNVRATITEEINKASSVCTMEDANATIKQYEENLFGNPGGGNEVSGTRVDRPSVWTSGTQPPLTLAQNQRVSMLQAIAGQAKVGPNAFLKIMAGDKIRAKADYYYLTDPGNSGNPNTGIAALVNSFAAALTSGRTITQIHGQNTTVTNNLNNNVSLQDLFNNPPPGSILNPNAPRAYLNYIFFDEQFNFVKEVSGFKRVSQSGNGASPLVLTEAKSTKNGYVYVYLSNETGVPVYFDNFVVSHERGQLIAEDHYYAYGLKIAAISSKSVSSSINTTITKFGYQGSFSEELTNFDLNYNEFELRTYDPQIGRWTTPDPYDEFASPYLGMGTDPANNVDPSGGSIWGALWSFFGGSVSAGSSGFVGVGNACAAIGSTSASCSGLATVARISITSFAIGGDVLLNSSSQVTAQSIGETQGSPTGGNGTNINQEPVRTDLVIHIRSVHNKEDITPPNKETDDAISSKADGWDDRGGDWHYIVADDIGEARAKVYAYMKKKGIKQFGNIIIISHASPGSLNVGDKVGDNIDEKELKSYNDGGTIDPYAKKRIEEFKDVVQTVKEGGSVLLTACNIVLGDKGDKFGTEVITVINKKINLYLNKDWTSSYYQVDKGKPFGYLTLTRGKNMTSKVNFKNGWQKITLGTDGKPLKVNLKGLKGYTGNIKINYKGANNIEPVKKG